MTTDLSIVIPCYNEQEVLPETISRLTEVLVGLIEKQEISYQSRVYFVDDGSKDRTWQLIEEASRVNRWIKGIKLSRNHGHQTALIAGLLTVPGDAVISVDADLQDDLGAMSSMLAAYRQGSEIVYGVRQSRARDTWTKRFTAEAFYKLMNLAGAELLFNHADYRLMGRRALTALSNFQESNLFLRGIIPQLGFPSSIVYYDRMERFAGESKYSAGKMLALAWDGISSFSAVPLRLITVFGLIVSVASLCVSVWALYIRLFGTGAVPGWASTVIPLYFLGGVQLLALGVIGEYLAKTYVEVKHRPRFHIDKEV
jgi:glycosyltransferase involved in cell wall biosynthesis